MILSGGMVAGLEPPTLCVLQCSGTPPGQFPTPFLHMNLHYVLGGTASPPCTRLTSKIRQGERQEAGKLLPMVCDKQFGEESHALFVSWPWRFPMRWGNGAKLQHLPCAMDDLCLQLHQALQAHGTRCGGQLGTWRGEAGGIPGCVPCLQLCRFQSLYFGSGMAGKDFINGQLGVGGVDLQSFL